MTQSKCFHFPTWEEKRNITITLNQSHIGIEDSFDFKGYYITNLEHMIEYIPQSTPSDPIFQKYPLLLELQNKLGFDVYGEYVVLEDKFHPIDENIRLGLSLANIFNARFTNKPSMNIDDFTPRYSDSLEELSKHYRGEENEF